MIIGIGTDIVDIDRIEGMIERHGLMFIERTFTSAEHEYCAGHKASGQHYAGRWAAKEAVMKCLGTGFVKGVHWTEIEVVNQQSGRPIIQLTGETADLAKGLGIANISVSISHAKNAAVAFAVAEGE